MSAESWKRPRFIPMSDADGVVDLRKERWMRGLRKFRPPWCSHLRINFVGCGRIGMPGAKHRPFSRAPSLVTARAGATRRDAFLILYRIFKLLAFGSYHSQQMDRSISMTLIEREAQGGHFYEYHEIT